MMTSGYVYNNNIENDLKKLEMALSLKQTIPIWKILRKISYIIITQEPVLDIETVCRIHTLITDIHRSFNNRRGFDPVVQEANQLKEIVSMKYRLPFGLWNSTR